MPKHTKKVNLLSKEGDFIKTFDNIKSVSNELKCQVDSISKSISYKTLIQNKYRAEYEGAINIADNLSDSYLRIRITKQEKAVLKNLVELRNTTMTDFVKSLIDEYLKNNS